MYVYDQEAALPYHLREHQLKCPECGTAYVGRFGRPCPNSESHPHTQEQIKDEPTTNT